MDVPWNKLYNLKGKKNKKKTLAVTVELYDIIKCILVLLVQASLWSWSVILAP